MPPSHSEAVGAYQSSPNRFSYDLFNGFPMPLRTKVKLFKMVSETSPKLASTYLFSLTSGHFHFTHLDLSCRCKHFNCLLVSREPLTSPSCYIHYFCFSVFYCCIGLKSLLLVSVLQRTLEDLSFKEIFKVILKCVVRIIISTCTLASRCIVR